MSGSYSVKYTTPIFDIRNAEVIIRGRMILLFVCLFIVTGYQLDISVRDSMVIQVYIHGLPKL